MKRSIAYLVTCHLGVMEVVGSNLAIPIEIQKKSIKKYRFGCFTFKLIVKERIPSIGQKDPNYVRLHHIRKGIALT